MTNILHLDFKSSGRISEFAIFFTLADILLLDVSWIAIVSPFPIAKMSNRENKSFFRFVNAL